MDHSDTFSVWRGVVNLVITYFKETACIVKIKRAANLSTSRPLYLGDRSCINLPIEPAHEGEA